MSFALGENSFNQILSLVKKSNDNFKVQGVCVWKLNILDLIRSASGGFAMDAMNFYKRLASKLVEKWDQPYSKTMNWLQCTMSFALLRSAIQCVRCARSTPGHAVNISFSPVDLVIAEGSIRSG